MLERGPFRARGCEGTPVFREGDSYPISCARIYDSIGGDLDEFVLDFKHFSRELGTNPLFEPEGVDVKQVM